MHLQILGLLLVLLFAPSAQASTLTNIAYSVSLHIGPDKEAGTEVLIVEEKLTNVSKKPIAFSSWWEGAFLDSLGPKERVETRVGQAKPYKLRQADFGDIVRLKPGASKSFRRWFWASKEFPLTGEETGGHQNEYRILGDGTLEAVVCRGFRGEKEHYLENPRKQLGLKPSESLIVGRVCAKQTSFPYRVLGD